TKERFGGNHAAVCLLDESIPTDLQQKIEAEINLSETAFVLKNGNAYDLRWFTPKLEVELCVHATFD
ncbi:PhzF family phenazine biosynthesis protein, partial [Anaerovorax odorimutans]